MGASGKWQVASGRWQEGKSRRWWDGGQPKTGAAGASWHQQALAMLQAWCVRRNDKLKHLANRAQIDGFLLMVSFFSGYDK
jgi:hypothetical protein